MTITQDLQPQTLTFTQMIDLSTGIERQAVHEPWLPSIRRIRHDVEGLEWMENAFGVDREELTQSGGLGAAFEEITAITHCGTACRCPLALRPDVGGQTGAND